MTARVFAETNDVNHRTLLWWRSELRRSADAVVERNPEARFVEVVDEPDVPGARVRVSVRCGDAVIECDGLPPASWLREVAGAC